MKTTDADRLSMILGACADLYGKSISEGAMSLWWGALERFDIEQVEQAFKRTIEDPDGGQYMPRPADIIRRIEGTASDRSLIAWGKVLDAARHVGAYQSVVFDDAAIHAAINDMGGWPKVCRLPTDDLPFTQKRFCDLHRAYSTRPGHAYPARLVGDHEESNALRGYDVAPPLLIGDAKLAIDVARRGGGGCKTTVTSLIQSTGDAMRLTR